jgi:ribonuclease E
MMGIHTGAATKAPVEVAEPPVEVAEPPVAVVEAPVEAADAPVAVAEAPVAATEDPAAMATLARFRTTFAAAETRASALWAAAPSCINQKHWCDAPATAAEPAATDAGGGGASANS